MSGDVEEELSSSSAKFKQLLCKSCVRQLSCYLRETLVVIYRFTEHRGVEQAIVLKV